MKQSPVAIGGYSMLFREGLQSLLLHTHFTVVTSVPSLDEIFSDLSKARPELIVYALSDADDVTAQLHKLRTRKVELEGIRIVLLRKRLTAEILSDAANAHVQAVLSSDITSDVLRRCLDLVMLDQHLFSAFPKERPSDQVATALMPLPLPAAEQSRFFPGGEAAFQPEPVRAHATRPTALSDRERQILRRLADGASNKTIGRDLQITEATVKVHIKGLLRKLQVRNRTQAAVWGLNNAGQFDELKASPAVL